MNDLHSMKTLAAILVIALAGCSTRTDSTKSSADSAKTQGSSISQVNDSTMFIGVVHEFANNEEIYTDLYFKDNSDPELYDFVAKSVDSLVYQGDQIKRSAVAYSVADEYFDLRGLFKINVYDSANRFIGTAGFERVEFIEEIIEDGFVAVFRPDKKFCGEPAYCLTNATAVKSISNFTYTSRKTKTVDKKILEELNQPLSIDLNVVELKLSPSNITYLVISADTLSFIYKKEDRRLLYTSPGSENIFDVTPIQIEANGEPMLLVGFAVPETDIFWNALMKFNGKQYEVCPRSRFKPSSAE